MSKIIQISYPITEEGPVWPGFPRFSKNQLTSIEKGDAANTFELNLFNHYGSHIDGPKHFNQSGPAIAELPLDHFIYERPCLIDLPRSFGERIIKEDLAAYRQLLEHADLLLIRTGFSGERRSSRYAREGPGIHSSASQYLVEGFPGLKALALDTISLASYTDQVDGVLSHQYLLGKFNPGRFCLIIEDLDFSQLDPEKLGRVLAFPLFLVGVDSAPVTVVAELAD